MLEHEDKTAVDPSTETATDETRGAGQDSHGQDSRSHGSVQQSLLRAGSRRRRPVRRHWRETHRPSEVAVRCAQILDEGKLEGIEIFDVADSLQITDYFVIAHGRTTRQIQGAAEQLSKVLRESGVPRSGMEGYREGRWILLDFDDLVVHLFLPDSRKFYDLELLWGDCPRLGWIPSPRPTLAADDARPDGEARSGDEDPASSGGLH